LKEFGTAVILCGGKSSRMGFDKSMIKIGEKLLIEFICERLKDIFDEIILIAEDKNKFGEFKFKVLEDLKKDFGPAGGIYTGLKYASSENVFFMACDMPVVNLEYIRLMKHILQKQHYEGIVPRNNKWIEPLYAFYSKNLIMRFEKGINENNLVLHKIIKNSNIFYIPEHITKVYNKGLNMFTNMNFMRDLEALKDINISPYYKKR
jgi:molybdopterin-guanine dinucleotide biosynthesis protein A